MEGLKSILKPIHQKTHNTSPNISTQYAMDFTTIYTQKPTQAIQIAKILQKHTYQLRQTSLPNHRVSSDPSGGE